MARRQSKKTQADAAERNGAVETKPKKILAIDIGGTKVKILASGETEPRKVRTGKSFTPQDLVAAVKKLAHDWEYEVVTIGIPGPVGIHGPSSEPGNLGTGWVGFDFAAAFGLPVKVLNDAVMQALGSYEHGRMFFVGLGTGVGSALIADNVIVPMEIGNFPHDGDRTFGDVLGRAGLNKTGKREWRKSVEKLVPILMRVFIADYVVLGGGNAKYVKQLPVGARMGHNLTAFRGGFRIWDEQEGWIFAIPNNRQQQPPTPNEKDVALGTP